MDIVTVCFRDEINILRVQAQSIDKYCDPLEIKNILVCVNDDDDVVNLIDTNWWGQYSSLVKIYPRSKFSNHWCNNGWVSQQVCKILTSCESNCNFVMVLDAKSIFVRPVVVGNIIKNNKVQSGIWPIKSVWQPAVDACKQVFDVTIRTIAAPAGVPFVWIPCELKSMITWLELHLQQDFAQWFMQQGKITEFCLYSAWLVKNYQNLNNHYEEPIENQLNSINVCQNQNLVKFVQIISQASQINPLCVSVHRQFWQKLSEDQKTFYKNYLYSKGLPTSDCLQ